MPLPDSHLQAENSHDYTRGVFAMLSDRSWFGLLLPLWGVVLGALLACLGDIAFEKTADPGPNAGVEAQKRLVTAIPLMGALFFGLALTHHMDYTPPGTAVPWGLYLFLLVPELAALVNLTTLTVKVLRRKGDGVNAHKAEQVRDSLHIGDRSSSRSSGSIAMQSDRSSSRSAQSTPIALRESLLSAGSGSEGSRDSTRSRSAPLGRNGGGRGVGAISPMNTNSAALSTVMNPAFGTQTMYDDWGDSLDDAVADDVPVTRFDTVRQAGNSERDSSALFGQHGSVRSANSKGTDASDDMSDFSLADDISALERVLARTGSPFSVATNDDDGLSATSSIAENQSIVSATSSLADYEDRRRTQQAIRTSSPGVMSLFSKDGDPISNVSIQSDDGSIPGALRLTKRTVTLGMCVAVNARFADPKFGLYGDTVACDGLFGVVEQWDNSDSCKVYLADGRQHWVQCQSLIQIPDPTSVDFTGFSDVMTNNRHSLIDLSTQLISKHGLHSPAMKMAIEMVNCGDGVGARRAVEQLNPGEVDSTAGGYTLLQLAADAGFLAIVTMLLEHDADPNVDNSQGTTALHCAVAADELEDGAAIAAALLEAGARINQQDKAGYCALHLAAEQGHDVMAELLVAMGAQSNLRSRDTKETPLMCAVRSQAIKIAELLVEQAQCDVNATDGNGDSALHLAFTIANVDDAFVAVGKYLIEHGANAVLKNQQGDAALDICPEEHFDHVKEFFIAAQVETLLASERQDATVTKGCRVRIRPEVTEPAHGFQGVTHQDELVVRDIDDAEVGVTFIDPATKLRFTLAEVYRVFDNTGAILTASTGENTVYNMFNPDPNVYWQSDGERGQHWFCVRLPNVGELICCEVEVDQGGVAYIPKRVEVHTGETMETLKPYSSTEVVSYGWTAVVPNDNQVRCRFIKVMVRSCHESGINCRVAGLRLLYSFQGQTVTVPSSTGMFVPLSWEDVNIGNETGKRLKGRYKLGRKIARGGFGITYMATDEDCFNEQVLIKFLHRLPGLELFRREARRLLDINHPQIPRLKAYFELKDDAAPDDTSKSKFALVMEMVHGRNLVDILDDEGPWDEAATYAMLVSVLRVLTHVHRKGIVHRDIKAGNVMRRDADGVYFVIDFGACTTSADDGTSRVIGTPGYMAPEAAHGKNCCESDLFSLGVLGLYMLKGTEPYMLMDKGSPAEPFRGVLDELSAGGQIGNRCFELLHALLRPEPNSRRMALDAIADIAALP